MKHPLPPAPIPAVWQCVSMMFLHVIIYGAPVVITAVRKENFNKSLIFDYRSRNNQRIRISGLLLLSLILMNDNWSLWLYGIKDTTRIDSMLWHRK
jgi:hypothetical protein